MGFSNIRPSRIIPYFDQEKSILKSLINGGKSRGIHPIIYALRRMKNYILLMVALISPINRMRVCYHRWRGVNIGKDVYIGMFCFLDNAYPEYIYIEDNASINTGTMVLAHFNVKSHFKDLITATVDPVIIKEGAILAVKSIVLPGVTIGTCSIVSAGSVVNRTVPDFTLVCGNPAKKITSLKIKS